MQNRSEHRIVTINNRVYSYSWGGHCTYLPLVHDESFISKIINITLLWSADTTGVPPAVTIHNAAVMEN